MTDPSKQAQTPPAGPDTQVAVAVLPSPSGALLVHLSARCGDLSIALALTGTAAVAIGEMLGAAGRQAQSGIVVAREVPGNGSPLRPEHPGPPAGSPPW